MEVFLSKRFFLCVAIFFYFRLFKLKIVFILLNGETNRNCYKQFHHVVFRPVLLLLVCQKHVFQ